MLSQQELKQQAADAALEFVDAVAAPDVVIGVGTGSTADLFIDGLARSIGTRSKQGRFACEVLVSGIITMVTARIGAGDTAELRSLRKPLADLVRRALS